MTHFFIIFNITFNLIRSVFKLTLEKICFNFFTILINITIKHQKVIDLIVHYKSPFLNNNLRHLKIPYTLEYNNFD